MGGLAVDGDVALQIQHLVLLQGDRGAGGFLADDRPPVVEAGEGGAGERHDGHTVQRQRDRRGRSIFPSLATAWSDPTQRSSRFSSPSLAIDLIRSHVRKRPSITYWSESSNFCWASMIVSRSESAVIASAFVRPPTDCLAAMATICSRTSWTFHASIFFAYLIAWRSSRLLTKAGSARVRVFRVIWVPPAKPSICAVFSSSFIPPVATLVPST